MLKNRRSAMRLGASVLALSALILGPVHAKDHNRSSTPAWCGDRCDEVVVDWNATAHRIITVADGYQDPMNATRVFAMMHLAMHDAVNSVEQRYEKYLPSDDEPGADPVVAAAAAAHEVLSTLYPEQGVILDAALQQTLLDAGIAASVSEGRELGERVAAAMIESRANDGSSVTETYVPGTGPGEYRFTPGFNFLASPHWGKVQPFGLNTPDQYRLGPPPALTSYFYTRDFMEVKSKGDVDSATRTQDETHYAAFWYEFSDIGWNRIARVVARDRKQDLWDRARTFALLNIALADAYISGWDSKMHYDFWRPITAIHFADIDGNPKTDPDTTFSDFLPSPPVQDYPSTHSALGAAAAVVLTDAFGHQRFSFRSSSAVADNPERTFRSFWQAARENADSRVMAGLHFRFSCDAGLKLGTNVGRHATREVLRKLK